MVLRQFVFVVGPLEEATLPQYADQQSQQQDACQNSDKDDPPGDPVLVSETRFRIDHHWNLCSCVLEDQVFDAGLHSDVGSDQQLQSTGGWKILYETAIPQPGVNLEDSLTGEAVEGTLEQNTACRPQETIQFERLASL